MSDISHIILNIFIYEEKCMSYRQYSKAVENAAIWRWFTDLFTMSVLQSL